MAACLVFTSVLALGRTEPETERLRPLPLPVVLAALEALPDPHDPAKWHTARGVLSVSGPKFMNWGKGSGGGGAIDLVMHLRQIGFGQALE